MTYQNFNNQLNKYETEVELVNWNANGKLGFSITGGVGSQHIRGDDGIYVKSITEGGLISWDGRVWVGDKLVAVKPGLDGERINLTGCTHDVAVAILKRVCSGKRVVLVVKKCEVTLTNWNKNDPLGISISGGINREHIPGDSRIYITSIVECGTAAKDGRMSVGDRLLGVKRNLKSKGMRSDDFFLLDKCTHEDAVSALQEARKGKNVVLIICKGDNIHHRLRFDDKEMMSNEIEKLKNPSSNFCEQNLSQNKTMIPPRLKTLNNVTAKSILKPKKPLKQSITSDACPDEGLGDISNNTKKPVRIRYVTGEPINEDSTEVISNSPKLERSDEEIFNTLMPQLTENIEGLSLIRPNDKRNCSGSSTSSSSSIYDYDSALSSMSSEDESYLLNFSNVENALMEDSKPKLGHQRQRSKHLIEPLILKSDAPESQLSRPVLNKDRMFLSTTLKDGMISHEIIKPNKILSNEENSNAPIDENYSRRDRYFHQRYNISKQSYTTEDQSQVNSSNISKDSMKSFNTNQFVKFTRQYQL